SFVVCGSDPWRSISSSVARARSKLGTIRARARAASSVEGRRASHQTSAATTAARAPRNTRLPRRFTRRASRAADPEDAGAEEEHDERQRADAQGEHARELRVVERQAQVLDRARADGDALGAVLEPGDGGEDEVAVVGGEEHAVRGDLRRAEDDEARALAGAFGALGGDGDGDGAFDVLARVVAQVGFGAEDAEVGLAPAGVAGVHDLARVDAGLGGGADLAHRRPEGLMAHEARGDWMVGVALRDREGDGGAAQAWLVDDDVVARRGTPAIEHVLDADVDEAGDLGVEVR